MGLPSDIADLLEQQLAQMSNEATKQRNAMIYADGRVPTPAKAPEPPVAVPVELDEYNRLRQTLLDEAQFIAEGKRPAYTNGSEDVLANFRRIAALAQMTPGKVLAVYLMKHVLSVVTALTNPTVTDSESALSRFADAMNYLCLGWAMVATKAAHEEPK